MVKMTHLTAYVIWRKICENEKNISFNCERKRKKEDIEMENPSGARVKHMQMAGAKNRRKVA
jgi:hypothetical protein